MKLNIGIERELVYYPALKSAEDTDARCGPAEDCQCGLFGWSNPRLGKIIREIRLNGTAGFRGAHPGFENSFGPVVSTNAVMLKALNVVKARQPRLE
jgi:hypothetical protein